MMTIAKSYTAEKLNVIHSRIVRKAKVKGSMEHGECGLLNETSKTVS